MATISPSDTCRTLLGDCFGVLNSDFRGYHIDQASEETHGDGIGVCIEMLRYERNGAC